MRPFKIPKDVMPGVDISKLEPSSLSAEDLIRMVVNGKALEYLVFLNGVPCSSQSGKKPFGVCDINV
jgi:hypothetical protein